MSAQFQELKASNMLDGKRTVKTVVGKNNAPAKQDEEPAEASLMPENVAVNNITCKTAEVTWDGDADAQYNVRYRKYVVNGFWDFEDNADDWTMIDADGDEINWQYINNSVTVTHSGTGVMGSFSFNNNTGSALTPDNWLISPEVTLDGTLSFWAVAQDPKYPEEHFAVYATTGDPTNTESFVEIMPETIVTDKMTEYTVDLSAYAGQKGYIAFRHFNSTDMFLLNIDDVAIITIPKDEWTVAENVSSPYDIEGLTPETNYEVQVQTVGSEEWTESVRFKTLVLQAITPTNLTEQEVGENYATISWRDYGETIWNVRYRKHVVNSFWDFEEDADDWTMIDADGDGHNWQYINNSGNVAHSGTGTMTSFSFDNNTAMALTPDNWLISPEATLDGTLSFWAAGQDVGYYNEHFAVYATTGDPTNTESFVEIIPETVTEGEMTEYTADLSAYAGQKGYIAFRHFNITDMFRLNIDDVAITIGPEYEWTVVEGVTENPYTIEGLESGEAYDVQIQTVGEAGDVSKWSKILTFTTITSDAIVEVTNENTNNAWYNINGARLNGKPTQKGIYILNGKKVMVK